MNGGISPHAPVEIEYEKARQLDRNDPEGRVLPLDEVLWRDFTVKPEIIGEIVGAKYEKSISNQHYPEIAVF